MFLESAFVPRKPSRYLLFCELLPGDGVCAIFMQIRFTGFRLARDQNWEQFLKPTCLPTYLPMQVQSNQQYFVPEPTGKYVTSVTRFGEILPFWLLLWLVVNFLGP